MAKQFDINIKNALVKTGLVILFLILNGVTQIAEISGSNFVNEIIDAIPPIIILLIIFGVNIKK